MRALAWWQAVPEPPKSAQARSSSRAARPVSRRAKAEAEEREVFMPHVVDEAPMYLVDTLLEAGPASGGGLGPQPLTWTDLNAWQRATGIELAPWEARLVRRLSAEYLDEHQRAREPTATPPWESINGSTDVEQVAQDMRAAIRAMADK